MEKANGKVSKSEVKEPQKAKKTEKKDAEKFAPRAESKAAKFLEMVKASKSKGVSMGEAVKAPWNAPKKSTFYKLSARLEKAGLLVIKDGKFFPTEKKEKEPRP